MVGYNFILDAALRFVLFFKGALRLLMLSLRATWCNSHHVGGHWCRHSSLVTQVFENVKKKTREIVLF